MSKRGVPAGPYIAQFITHSRRQRLAVGRADTTITAMTYLRASKITVITKAQLLRTLRKAAPLLCLCMMTASALAQVPPLCVHGHPAPRAHDVTYTGLPPRHGYQRDHVCPLGLGCPDAPGNVRYQRCDRTGLHGRCEAGPAAVKDADEHTAEEKLCSGAWPIDYARTWLATRWPVDAAHGYEP